MHTRAQLAGQFRALGVRSGDVVMLHASVRAVGEVAGGPDEIHLALKDALGDRGTLLLYAGVPRYVDEIGRGNLTPEEEAEVFEKLPAFDALTARAARDHGILVEFLRTSPGSRVNAHPARFVARGAQAEHLLSSTPWDFAFGYGSPLDRLVVLDGKVLLLGCDHDNVTFLHYVEHVADIPGRRVAQFKVPVLEGSRRVWRHMQEFDTSEAGVHPHWPERLFARLVDSFLRTTGNTGGRVGDAGSYLFSARALQAHAQPIMERLAVDSRAADGLQEL